jgi:hypothetical protein
MIVTGIKRICAWAGISERTLYTWREAGFPVRVLGGTRFLIVAEAVEWMRVRSTIMPVNMQSSGNGPANSRQTPARDRSGCTVSACAIPIPDSAPPRAGAATAATDRCTPGARPGPRRPSSWGLGPAARGPADSEG